MFKVHRYIDHSNQISLMVGEQSGSNPVSTVFGPQNNGVTFSLIPWCLHNETAWMFGALWRLVTQSIRGATKSASGFGVVFRFLQCHVSKMSGNDKWYPKCLKPLKGVLKILLNVHTWTLMWKMQLFEDLYLLKRMAQNRNQLSAINLLGFHAGIVSCD